MNVIGIDPGLDGGIAFIGPKGAVAWAMPTGAIGTKRMIDANLLRTIIILRDQIDMVVLEDVNAGAVKSVMSAFAFGRGYGRIEGLLTALDRPHCYVASPTWTKAVGITKGAKKPEHIEVARRLYPDLGPLRDGPADALLIAHWYLTTHGRAVA